MKTIVAARVRHYAALEAMLPPGSTKTGIETWRQLRRLERTAARCALRMCNGPEVKDDEWERVCASVTRGVEKVFGYLPAGFFINSDARGWALKLEPGSVPYDLHRDMGDNQILAPLIQ